MDDLFAGPEATGSATDSLCVCVCVWYSAVCHCMDAYSGLFCVMINSLSSPGSV